MHSAQPSAWRGAGSVAAAQRSFACAQNRARAAAQAAGASAETARPARRVRRTTPCLRTSHWHRMLSQKHLLGLKRRAAQAATRRRWRRGRGRPPLQSACVRLEAGAVGRRSGAPRGSCVAARARRAGRGAPSGTARRSRTTVLAAPGGGTEWRDASASARRRAGPQRRVHASGAAVVRLVGPPRRTRDDRMGRLDGDGCGGSGGGVSSATQLARAVEVAGGGSAAPPGSLESRQSRACEGACPPPLPSPPCRGRRARRPQMRRRPRSRRDAGRAAARSGSWRSPRASPPVRRRAEASTQRQHRHAVQRGSAEAHHHARRRSRSRRGGAAPVSNTGAFIAKSSSAGSTAGAAARGGHRRANTCSREATDAGPALTRRPRLELQRGTTSSFLQARQMSAAKTGGAGPGPR